MRRKHITLLCIFLLTACAVIGCMSEKTRGEIDEVDEQMERQTDTGRFLGVVSDWVNWDDAGDFVGFTIDEELALDIGNAVLRRVYGENVIEDTRFLVGKIAGKDCFIITRLPKNHPALGGEYNVAINANGEILKIWMVD